MTKKAKKTKKEIADELENVFKPVFGESPNSKIGKLKVFRISDARKAGKHPYWRRQAVHRKNLILEWLLATGNLNSALRNAKVTRQAFEHFYETDATFREEFDFRFGAITGYLEEIALEKAKDDVSMLRFLLEAREPEVYGRGQQAGTNVGVQVIIKKDFGGEAVEAKPLFETKSIADERGSGKIKAIEAQVSDEKSLDE